VAGETAGVVFIGRHSVPSHTVLIQLYYTKRALSRGYGTSVLNMTAGPGKKRLAILFGLEYNNARNN
jgi:hypothetical protein